MKQAKIFFKNQPAGILTEVNQGKLYRFEYFTESGTPSISLSMPCSQQVYEFDRFPSFFDGLLPEGLQLEGLLKQVKLDRNDYMGQLIAVGHDLVGAVTVEEIL